MWKSGGLHNFIKLCKTHNCYKPTIICKCNLHVLDADQLRHIDECAWAVAGDNHRHIIISPRNINKVVFILEKGLSADDVYDRATWRRMSSYIDPT